jgi:hypothetical protein
MGQNCSFLNSLILVLQIEIAHYHHAKRIKKIKCSLSVKLLYGNSTHPSFGNERKSFVFTHSAGLKQQSF